jgi:hypothetical protein
MLKKIFFCGLVAAAFTAGLGSGFVLNQRMPALAAETAVEMDLGGGAPTKVLLDNGKMRVTLVNFQKGTVRPGDMRRRADQLIVYLEDGDFKTVPRPGATRPASAGNRPAGAVVCDPIKDCGPIRLDGMPSQNPHQLGTIAWHPEGSMTPTLQINNTYRALYVELKK